MSDDARTQSTEAVSLADQVQYANEHAGSQRIRTIGADDIDALRAHCKDFIESANISQHARKMALPKLDEMIFWIRAGAGRG